MRYSVMFDEVTDSWAVIDTNAAGMTIAFHPDQDAALQQAATWNGDDASAVAAE